MRLRSSSFGKAVEGLDETERGPCCISFRSRGHVRAVPKGVIRQWRWRRRSSSTGEAVSESLKASAPRQPVDHRHQQGRQDEEPRGREIGRIPGQVAAARFLHLGEKPVA
ncbi:MAG: hypothetical protein MZV70_76190 [Desulfobacterales bacterium]|nr:hypothetical protein [Desulfobacterales bacterium]